MVKIVQASTHADVETVRGLFQEYAASLSFDLSFQNFAQELASLPGDYAPPEGCLLLAWHEGQAVGCVAMRKLDDVTCEMKRLYIKPAFRGLGLGRGLAEANVAQAKTIGYTAMRLDTVPSMAAAQALYRSMGFYEVAPYRYNPIPDTAFMELCL